MLTKKCRKCKESLDIDKFYPDRLGKFGVASTCIFCKKLHAKPQKELKRVEIQKVGKKRKERLKNEGSELDFFKTILKNKIKDNTNFCIICKKKITEKNVSPASFPHILPKGKYPELRYFKSNLQFLVCGIEHHNKFDLVINKLKKEIGLMEFKKLIVNGKKINLENYIK